MEWINSICATIVAVAACFAIMQVCQSHTTIEGQSDRTGLNDGRTDIEEE